MPSIPQINPTQADIQRTIQSIKDANDAKLRSYQAPQQYSNFMPQTLNTKTPDDSDYYNLLQGTSQQGQNATALSIIEAQNKQNKIDALNAQKQAQNSANSGMTGGSGYDWSQPLHIDHHPLPGSGSPGSYRDFNPKAPLKNYNWQGHHLRLNSSVASHFIGFLNALSARGYKVVSLGSYENRNIAGTNKKSLHALGDAIDINPSQNQVTYNGHLISNLPPGVGALAARYGLTWGGSSRFHKRDAMHFSYAIPGYSY